jgi:hypothetical protein
MPQVFFKGLLLLHVLRHAKHSNDLYWPAAGYQWNEHNFFFYCHSWLKLQFEILDMSFILYTKLDQFNVFRSSSHLASVWCALFFLTLSFTIENACCNFIYQDRSFVHYSVIIFLIGETPTSENVTFIAYSNSVDSVSGANIGSVWRSSQFLAVQCNSYITVWTKWLPWCKWRVMHLVCKL